MDKSKNAKNVKIIEIPDNEYVSQDDFVKAFSVLTAALAELKKQNNFSYVEVVKSLQQKLEILESGFRQRLSNTNADIGTKANKADIQSLSKALRDIRTTIEDIREEIPEEITSSQIREKLFDGSYKIPATNVDLPDFVSKSTFETAIVEMGGHILKVEQRNARGYGALGGGSEGTGSLFLSRLRDVNVDGLTKDNQGRYVLGSGSSTGTTPGGSNTSVQYNDGGIFGGDDNFAWDKTSQYFNVQNATADSYFTFYGVQNSTYIYSDDGSTSSNDSNFTPVGFSSDVSEYNVSGKYSGISSTINDGVVLYAGTGSTYGEIDILLNGNIVLKSQGATYTWPTAQAAGSGYVLSNNGTGTLSWAALPSLTGYLQNNVGIAGGTTLIGGTASGENLTLSSTSNATKGKILFGTSAYDENLKQLILGATSVSNVGTATPFVISGNASVASFASSFFLNETANALSRNWVIGNGSGPNYGDLAFHVSATQNGVVSNTPVMVITKAGSVGIGTTNPGTKLQIGTASASVVSDGTIRTASGDGAGNYATWDFGSSPTINPYGFYIKNSLRATPDLNIAFSTGNIGIGTASPDQLLRVSSASNVTPGTRTAYAFGVTQGSIPVAIGSDASYGYLQSFGGPLQINNQGNNTILNALGGSVGIGTASPGALLQLDSSGQNGIYVSHVAPNLVLGDNAAYGSLTNSTVVALATSAGNYLTSSAAGDSIFAGKNNLLFGTGLTPGVSNGTIKMTLTTAGSLGVGVLSPNAKLHIVSTTEQLRLGYDASNYSSFTTNSTGSLTIAPTNAETIFTGNAKISTYLRVGGTTAPTNTTTGDFTAIRGVFTGQGIVIGTSTFTADRAMDVRSTSTSTASQAFITNNFLNTIQPATNSSSAFRALNFQNTASAASGITINSIEAGHFEGARFNSTMDGQITSVTGGVFWGAVPDSGSTATISITGIWGISAVGSTRPSGTSTILATTVIGGDFTAANNGSLTATNAFGIRVNNSGIGNTISNTWGIDVLAQTRGGTTNTGIRIAAPSGATNNYALNLSDTGGTTAGGITFATDTTLYRSAASTLKTDGAFTIGAYTLPNTDGTAGQVLSTNGSGVTTWTDMSGIINGVATLSSAQILSINTSPVTVISAPGVGKAILLLSAYSVYTYGTTSYVGTGAGTIILRSNTSGAGALTVTSATQLHAAVSGYGYSGLSNSTGTVSGENTAVTLTSAENPTGGDGTIKTYFQYRIITL